MRKYVKVWENMIECEKMATYLDLLRLEILRLEWLPRRPLEERTTPPEPVPRPSGRSSESTWMVRGRGFIPAPADLAEYKVYFYKIVWLG